MTEYVAASLFGAKVAASLLSVLSGLGLLLAAIGLYSVMAYAVAQRTARSDRVTWARSQGTSCGW